MLALLILAGFIVTAVLLFAFPPLAWVFLFFWILLVVKQLNKDQ